MGYYCTEHGCGTVADMPELPEVETSRRGIEPHLKKQTVTLVNIRQPRMRWPIPDNIPQDLQGQEIQSVDRRGKYLLITTLNGTLILHLGMSGSVRITEQGNPYRQHDHFAFSLENGKELRLYDPRRFGSVLWQTGDPLQHPLLAKLGPEPLLQDFTAEHLYTACQGRRCSIKQHIMNSQVVVGVGNIYASESLFIAGISPKRAAGKVSKIRISRLHASIVEILTAAIEQGGTTLKDFVNEEGKPGYFKQQLNVYGREGEPCPNCQRPIKNITLGQRSTYYCSYCQR